MSDAKVESQDKPAEQLFIFEQQDLKQVQRLKLGILYKPLTYLAVTSALVFVGKKLNLRRLIANPFRQEQAIKKNDKYWKYATLNGILVGTGGFLGFAFYRNELNKVVLYKKYEREVGIYMKWRAQRQVRKYLMKQ